MVESMIHNSMKEFPVPPSAIGQLVFCDRLAWLAKNKFTKDTQTMTLGRKIHSSWGEFNREWIKGVMAYDRMKVKQLSHFLDSVSDRLVGSITKDRTYQKHLEAFLYNYSYQVIKVAEQVTQGKHFVPDDLVMQFFGAADPRFEYSSNYNGTRLRVDAIGMTDSNFTLIELKTGKTHSDAKQSHVFQAATAAIYLEETLGRQCRQIVIIYPQKNIRFPLTDKHRQQVIFHQGSYTAICRLPYPPEIPMENHCPSCSQLNVCLNFNRGTVTDSDQQEQLATASSYQLITAKKLEEAEYPSTTCLKESLQEYIGVILQNKKYNSSLKHGKSNLIWAKLKEEHVESLRDGDLVVIENNESAVRVFCEVQEINTFPAKASLNFKSTGELVTNVKLNPFMEIDEKGFSERPRQRDYHEYLMRRASQQEIARIHNLNGEGIPLGILVDENQPCDDNLPQNALVYRYPIEKENQGYKGIFITGSPGKGKSNALKLVICGMADYLAGGVPPAIIIIDVEGEYATLGRRGTGSLFDQEFWKKHGLKPVENLDVYTLSSESNRGTHTLDFSVLDPREMALMFPMLPGKSSVQFERIAKEIMIEGQKLTFAEFQQAFRLSSKQDDGLHESQKEAIVRALNTGLTEIFDQEGKYIDIMELLTPGKVSVIDCSQLEDYEMSRMAALYFFLALKKYKINVRNKDNKIILVFDEAHTIFPKSSRGEMETDYLDRVTKQVKEVVHLGRKRRYGLVFASQLPEDIAREITSLCQTKVVLGLESEKWVSTVLGSNYFRKVVKFAPGDAFIHCTDFHANPVRLKLPRAPCEHG
ncbi:MAG: helicase HerA domain-containing protein [Candidatus Odinarchaeota archaeon]